MSFLTHPSTRTQPTKQVIARTGPDLLTAALEAVGLKRTDGMFDKQYELNGDGERALSC